MAALQLEPLSEEWFQQLSALLDAPQAAALTSTQSFASGMLLSLVECINNVFFLLS